MPFPLSAGNKKIGNLFQREPLDAKRKRTALQFLAESELLGPWGILEDADLSEVDLSKLKLRNVNLSKTNLSRANLSGTDLLMTNLSGADLSRANLRGADLRAADLTDAIGITIEKLEKQGASLKGTTLLDGSKHS